MAYTLIDNKQEPIRGREVSQLLQKSVDHKKREKTIESIFPMTNKVASKQSFQLIRKGGSEWKSATHLDVNLALNDEIRTTSFLN